MKKDVYRKSRFWQGQSIHYQPFQDCTEENILWLRLTTLDGLATFRTLHRAFSHWRFLFNLAHWYYKAIIREIVVRGCHSGFVGTTFHPSSTTVLGLNPVHTIYAFSWFIWLLLENLYVNKMWKWTLYGYEMKFGRGWRK